MPNELDDVRNKLLKLIDYEKDHNLNDADRNFKEGGINNARKNGL